VGFAKVFIFYQAFPYRIPNKIHTFMPEATRLYVTFNSRSYRRDIIAYVTQRAQSGDAFRRQIGL